MTALDPTAPALLFDLYGVLFTDQTDSGLSSIEEAAGQTGTVFWSSYWSCRPAYDRGDVSSEEYWQAIAAQTGSPILDVDAAIDADLGSWLEIDTEMVSYAMGLAADGVSAGILSNLPEPLIGRIESAHPWLAQLAPRGFSARLGVAKPEPAAFEWAVEAFGSPAGNILFIDDRAPNIEAAQACGLSTHLFTGIDGLRRRVEAHLGGMPGQICGTPR